MTAQFEEDISALSKSYSLAVQNQVEGFKKSLELAAALDDVTESDPAWRYVVLDRLAKKSGFKYIALADSTGQTTRNSDISEREYFKEAMAGKSYMSSPLVNMVDGTVTIMAAVPVNNATGYKGVIYGGISYDVFGSVISNIKIGDGGYAFIVDKTGVIVAHPDDAIVENMTNFIELAKEDPTYQSVADAISRMIKGETGTARTYYNGLDRLYGFTPIEGPEQWSIAVTVPVTQIMSNIYSAIQYCLIAVAILMVLTVVIALMYARAIARPITAATKRIELLAEGDLSAPIPEARGRDEIARLNLALKTTIEELRSYIVDIAATLSAMANNDLTVGSAVAYKGDFAQIKDSLGHIMESMNSALSIINTSAEQVASGANLVSDSSIALSQGATEQASSVQQLSASLEEISAQTTKNAGNAQSANALVKNAKQNAEDGNTKMSDMLGAMEDINVSSSNIKNIIKVIDDIAFQTNILALNAAVEAARAGQHGKGFAVVAEEVRSLAVKSAQAAKETTELIEGSMKKVQAGTKIAGETAAALAEIGAEVAKAAQLVEEISMASEQQAASVEQIKLGIMQVSNVVQSIAATSEESAAASEELTGQAAQLKEIVGAFRLRKVGPQNDTGTPALPAAARALIDLGAE
jgi:methyl-accepting chemotaxis protein